LRDSTSLTLAAQRGSKINLLNFPRMSRVTDVASRWHEAGSLFVSTLALRFVNNYFSEPSYSY
jgi:hypothetical protein